MLGPRHPDTLIDRGNLAYWIGQAGVRRRPDQFAALLTIRDRVSGPEHPETLATRNNLAYWTSQAEVGSGPGMH